MKNQKFKNLFLLLTLKIFLSQKFKEWKMKNQDCLFLQNTAWLVVANQNSLLVGSNQLAGPCRWFASSRTSSGFKSQYKYNLG